MTDLQAPPRPRIALIHALTESVAPIHQAFAREWREALTFDLLDTSLARDLAAAGALERDMIERFVTLGRYAEAATGEGGHTAALLFTCSAFGPAIDAVKAVVSIPVLRPNEAAFEEALEAGSRIGLLVTFPPSLPALRTELEEMARLRGAQIEINAQVVDGALDALKRGDIPAHDRLIARTASRMSAYDCLVLGQFSMARAAAHVRVVTGRDVLTTPASAVRKLKRVLSDRGSV